MADVQPSKPRPEKKKMPRHSTKRARRDVPPQFKGGSVVEEWCAAHPATSADRLQRPSRPERVSPSRPTLRLPARGLSARRVAATAASGWDASLRKQGRGGI